MKIIESSGKTVEDAKQAILSDLALKEYESFDIEVVQQPSNGFLGLFGAKDAKIKLKIKTNKYQKAKTILQTMIESLGFKDVQFKERKGKKEMELQFDGEGADYMFNKLGRSSTRLEFLLDLMVNKNDPQFYLKTRLRYRKRNHARESYLKTTAKTAANKVQETKAPFSMQPMNSYDRRIVHNELKKFDNIKTHSEGDGEQRHIVIEYTEKSGA
jgi:spoIIIJ-associated protein